MNDNTDCIFCKIIHDQAGTQLLFQDDRVTAFYDISPVTPVHVLVVPNRHIASVNEVEPQDEDLLGHLITVAQHIAIDENIDQSGYRLVINTGNDAGQSVRHLHLHLIGGRQMPFRFQ
ncbi:MAG: histidine triad nucleotide-binding protein [Chloroflexi bacterium]|jgi:histidine triad (HIT) family protein|nr:histidine triad nucleotide-binding protein [Anaerolineaceae bacterium]NMB88223.1 histidine triad nucleotide-binding protein [Chloroflexota bacterium]